MLPVICFLQGASSEELARPGHTRSHKSSPRRKGARFRTHPPPFFKNWNQSELQGADLEVRGWIKLLAGGDTRIASATAFATE